MTLLRDYLSFAWLSDASYESIDYAGTSATWFGNIDSGADDGMPAEAARRLITGQMTPASYSLSYHVVHQSAPNTSGFSATLFREGTNGRLVLAVRGTQPLSILRDIVEADLFGIAANGIAQRQFADLLVYVQQLSTQAGQVVQFTDAMVTHIATLRNRLYEVLEHGVRRTRTIEELRADLAGTTGVGAWLSGTPFVATGHSLGGHLASLLGAYAPSRVSEVVTFNAPGFSSSRFSQLFGGIPLAVRANTSIDGEGGASVISGFRGHEGAEVVVFTERRSPGDPTGISDHSIARHSESFAVAELLSIIDPAITLASFNRLARESSADEDTSLESIVESLSRLLGLSNTGLIAVNDLDALHQRIVEAGIRATPVGTPTTRTIRVLSEYTDADLEALFQTDTGVRYALIRGEVFAVSGDEGLFVGPNAVGPASEYSSEYLHDRIGYLRALVFGNDGNLSTGPNQQRHIGGATTYVSSTADGAIELIPDAAYADPGALDQFFPNRPLVQFGTDANDTLGGPDVAIGAGQLRLYGGNGDDTLAGSRGSDLLDGGRGNDQYRIVAGEGNDTILDVDRSGTLWVQISGVWHQLTGAGERIDANSWFDADLDVLYFHDGDSLVISVGGSTITIRGWSSAGASNAAAGNEGGDAPGAADDGKAVLVGALGIAAPDFSADTLPTAPAYDTTLTVRTPAGQSVPSGRRTDDSNNEILGYETNEHIRGFGSYDFIRGNGGDDRVEGDEGDDTLRGDAGADVVIGGADLDVVLGGTGDDRLYAASETTRTAATAAANQPVATGLRGEYLDGGDGADTLVGAGGNDLLLGGAGDDWMFGSTGDDTLYGDNTTFDYRVNMDTTGAFAPWALTRQVTGGTATVSVQNAQLLNASSVGTGNDTIDGGAGDDWILGERTGDILRGGDGKDLLLAGDGEKLSLSRLDQTHNEENWELVRFLTMRIDFRSTRGDPRQRPSIVARRSPTDSDRRKRKRLSEKPPVRPRLLLIAAFAGSLCATAHAGRFEVAIGKREPMCQELESLLNSDVMPPTPTPLCMWRFEPRLPDKRFPQFTVPNWETVDAEAHISLIKSWHFNYYPPSRRETVSQDEVARRWSEDMEPFLVRLMAGRSLALRRSKIDIDATVSLDQRWVYGLWVSECTNPGYPDSNSPTMIVPRLDAPDEADPLFATHTLSGATPFFYYGQLRFTRWASPDGSIAPGGHGSEGESAKLTIERPFRLSADSTHFGVVDGECEFRYYSED